VSKDEGELIITRGNIIQGEFQIQMDLSSTEPFKCPGSLENVYSWTPLIESSSNACTGTRTGGGDQHKNEDDSGNGATIGIVLGSLGGALLLGGGGYWYWKKQKNAQGYQTIPPNYGSA
jgi:LPXTG-motif cell wall-anchored protein